MEYLTSINEKIEKMIFLLAYLYVFLCNIFACGNAYAYKIFHLEIDLLNNFVV